MVRPQKERRVAFNPEVSYFKPRGIPMFDLEEVCLTVDQREAIRLSDLVGMSHEEAGQHMGVSRATFGRINYQLIDKARTFRCSSCQHEWEEPVGTGRPPHCPACRDTDFYRIRKIAEP